MNYRNNFLQVFVLILVFLANVFCADDVELITDAQMDEIVSKHDYVLMLFQEDPCISEECKIVLRDTSLIANSSYIAGLKVVRLVKSALRKTLSLGNKSRLIFYRKTVPILFDSLEIRMDDVVMWLEQNKEPNSRPLDTSNFEHLTQAATGATTGDWFILFHSNQCNQVFPLWESAGSHLRHRINIAVVDIDASPELKKRFRITKCPTIIFFRLGRMYMYELSTKILTPFLQFVDGFYVHAPSFQVPSQPTPFDTLTDNVVAWLKALDAHELLNQTSFIIAISLLLALVVGCFCFRKKNKNAAESKSSKLD